MSEKIWSDDAWNDCKPEALKGNLQGEYSRRINDKDRLVYHMENGKIYIVHCRGHYNDK